MPSRFRDRIEAGELLAEKLADYVDLEDVVVLALPRGGVPVGYEVARRVRAPLDILMVRKLRVPGHEELAMGAVASGGICYLDRGLISQLRMPQADVDTEAAWQTHELARRENLMRGTTPRRDLARKTVILVDDGVATGSTMTAAIEAVRWAKARRVIATAPTWSSTAHAHVSRIADEAVGVTISNAFCSVGQWYEDFSEVSDDDVRNLLERADLAVFSRSPGDPKCASSPV